MTGIASPMNTEMDTSSNSPIIKTSTTTSDTLQFSLLTYYFMNKILSYF